MSSFLVKKLLKSGKIICFEVQRRDDKRFVSSTVQAKRTRMLLKFISKKYILFPIEVLKN